MTDIENNSLKRLFKGWVIVFTSASFYMYQFMIRVSPNIMNDELLLNFSLDSAGLGLLIGAYNWAYSGMQIPLGLSIDRLGPKIFLCMGAVVCAVSCFVFSNATNPIVGGIARFFMGAGSACGLIGTVKLGTIWLEPKHVAKVTGITILMGTFGASLGGAPLEMILQRVGFKDTMQLMATIGVLIGTLLYFVIPKKSSLEKDTVKSSEHDHPMDDILLLIKTPQALILGLYGMLMYAPITIIGVAWGVPYVKNVLGVSDLVAASVVSTMFLGAAVGSPCFAYLSDYINNRRLPMILGSIITTIVWSVILSCDLPISYLYILFFVAGFFYTAKCLSFASVCEAMPLRMTGISIAFLNSVVMLTGIIFLPIIGQLLDYNWDGEIINNIPLYTPEDYRFALVIIPVLTAISCILVIFLKETHPDHKMAKEQHDEMSAIDEIL